MVRFRRESTTYAASIANAMTTPISTVELKGEVFAYCMRTEVKVVVWLTDVVRTCEIALVTVRVVGSPEIADG